MEADTSARTSTSLSALLQTGRTLLGAAGIGNAEQETTWILESVLGCTRTAFFLERYQELSDRQWDAALSLLLRRAKREPLQYILGSQEFLGRDYAVGPAVLIPRPETELLVTEVAGACRARSEPTIVDLGTGSGCIAVSLAVALPHARIYATDMSPAALQVARSNARRHDVADRITFLEGDLWEPVRDAGLHGRLAAVVANPPYIADVEFPGLQPEVQYFEPRQALAGGPDGLAFHRRLVGDAAQYLGPGGCLMLEVGHAQASAVRQLAMALDSYDRSWTRPDHAGIERVVCLRRRA